MNFMYYIFVILKNKLYLCSIKITIELAATV